MDKERLYLWCGYPDDVADEAARDGCALILNEDERARWKAFRFEKHRREYLTSCALARFALSQYHSLAPEAWRFQVNAYGKPSPDPECGLRFNLSNSPGLVVCLIAHGNEVGVDLEPYEHAGEIARLSETAFSPLELAQLEELHGSEKTDWALSLWTLKEAYLKARGMGLSLPLNKFSFLFGRPAGIRLELNPCLEDEAERWRFCLLDRAGHRIAIAVDRADAFDLQFFETRPPLAAAIRIARGREVWYPLQPTGLDSTDPPAQVRRT
ncbi:MAG: 4'-phosphopantetheinyl transferase superfamily protein [Terracidiphilus sp.]